MSPRVRDTIAFVVAAAVCVLVAAVGLRPLGVFLFTVVRQHYSFVLALGLTLPIGVFGLAAVGTLTYDLTARLLGEKAASVAERRGMRLGSLAVLSLFLAVASAGVPERIETLDDLDELAFGHPIPYLLQSPSYHSYGHSEGVPLPAWVTPLSPLEHGSDLRWWALGLDVLSFFGLGLVVRRVALGRRATSRERDPEAEASP